MSPVPAKPGVEPRRQATEIVGRVLRSGAWSNVALRDLRLDNPDDRALVRFLVYGVLRHLEQVDTAIGAAVARPLESIEDRVLDILRVAAYESFFARSPDHAVTDSAVEVAKALGLDKASGFVNGVVRSIQRSGGPPDPTGISGAFGVDRGVVEELIAEWGEGPTIDFLEASRAPAPLGLRARPGAQPHASMESTTIPGAFVAEPGTSPPDGFAIQDPASVAVGVALEVQAGDRVVDLTAAPGGKTLHIVDAGPGQTVAVERNARRLRSARRRLDDLGAPVQWVRADATAPPLRAASFDRVLLDAPCSGLGTLRRRPEIRWKATTAEVQRLAGQQRSMLDAALGLLAPGGRLVYSVCTVTPSETTAIVAGTPARTPEGLPGRDLGKGLLMAPHLTGTDGMFIAVIDR